MKRRSAGFFALAVVVAVLASSGADGDRRSPRFEIVARVPHDTSAFTQGLVMHDGMLFESTGAYRHSSVRRVDPRTGRVLALRMLPSDRFGEGITSLNGRLYQLTWESRIGYVYDPATLAVIDSFPFAGEGWGLATDGQHLIASDGSDSLRFISPETFKVLRVLKVTHHGSPLKMINELEVVGSELLANVFALRGPDWIARIDLRSGNVIELIDFSLLFPRDARGKRAGVMNGIARGLTNDNLYLTGKSWPTLFEVRLLPRQSRSG